MKENWAGTKDHKESSKKQLKSLFQVTLKTLYYRTQTRWGRFSNIKLTKNEYSVIIYYKNVWLFRLLNNTGPNKVLKRINLKTSFVFHRGKKVWFVSTWGWVNYGIMFHFWWNIQWYTCQNSKMLLIIFLDFSTIEGFFFYENAFRTRVKWREQTA